MAPDHWKNQVVLNEGEKLRHEGSRTAGSMGEEDIDSYIVINASGEMVGSVVVRDHTAIRGFRRSIHFTQYDLSEKVIRDRRYEVT